MLGAKASLLWANQPSPFAAFMRWSDWLHARIGRTDSIALLRLMELLFEFLTAELKLEPKPVAATLWRDYQRSGRSDKPSFLRNFLPECHQGRVESPTGPMPGLKRQRRHVNA